MAEAKTAPLPHGARDAEEARVAAFVDLLLCVSYSDGLLHPREQEFVLRYLESLVVAGHQIVIGVDPSVAKRTRLLEIHGEIARELAGLAAEIERVSVGSPKIEARALDVFRSLGKKDQAIALEMVSALIHVDGFVTPPEQRIYDELRAFVRAAPPLAHAPTAASTTPTLVGAKPATRAVTIDVAAVHDYELKLASHPLLDPLEMTYSPHPDELNAQLARDYQLLHNAMNVWNNHRGYGTGRLAGLASADQVPVGSRFLDGHVHVFRPAHPVELVVLGDLHGCYGCLKAALLQSDFIRRAWAHQWDPANFPDVKLVLLGDYIDRGRFSFDGVMRTVLQLLVSLPDQVYVLRGNHEWFVRNDRMIRSGVYPAEAIASMAPWAPFEMLEGYRTLFEQMPSSLLVDRTLFVHAGIPRDDTFAERYRDLSSLNDPDLRFQMMWSDPTAEDHIPVELQRLNPRFSFGREQFRAFMSRIGCTTLVRGHEQIDAGFEVVYDLGEHQLINVFSAGGVDNRDLPEDAPYRKVTPMAVTILFDGANRPRAFPWRIQYEPFNYDTYNGFHRPIPLLEYRYT